MKVTVITIVRNGESYIQRTMESVLAQTFPNIEYIVIDGASTDSTLEVIRKYEGRINKIVSEADKGISDAWNKGIKMAKGDVIGLLNAGDEYAPDAVEKALAAMDAGADVTFGDTELVDDGGRVILHNRGKFHPWRYSGGFGMYHPSVFARKAVYDKVGGFDLSYKYAMDTDWFARVYKAGFKFQHCGTQAKMVDGGISVQRRFLAYGEHLHAMQMAGFSKRVIYLNILMTGLRGWVRTFFPR